MSAPPVDAFTVRLDAETRGAPRLAVKDVIDVAGLRTGAGHPDVLAHALPAADDADCVRRLRALGAVVVGKTHTDELAYSLGGTNAHYGAPPNPAAPARVTGGSSSGSASAVAAGDADLGLGTDTGGSVRVPASYTGLYGMRPTRARVAVDGMTPLAPTFDTPGLLTRDPETLSTGMCALLDGDRAAPGPLRRVLVPVDLWELADPATREALARRAAPLMDRLPVVRTRLFGPGGRLPSTLDEARTAFSAVQGAEAWRHHGAWVRAQAREFGPGVAARFARASAVTPDDEAAGRRVAALLSAYAAEMLDRALLVIPCAPGPAPERLGEGCEPVPGEADARRAATLGLTCLAGLAGLPALAVPGASVEGAPVGLCLVGAAGTDEDLLAVAAAL